MADRKPGRGTGNVEDFNVMDAVDAATGREKSSDGHLFGKPTVYVVDDDPGIRAVLGDVIRSEGWSVQVCSTGEEFLASYQPDRICCIVLDLQMPGIGGLDVQRKLKESDEMNPIICITGHADVPSAVQATRDGAVEFIEKPFSELEILSAIGRAILKSEEIQRARAKLRRVRARLHLLTGREKQILDMIVDGMLNREVAAELGLSRRTVEVHRNRLMKKMRAETVVDLVRLVLSARG